MEQRRVQTFTSSPYQYIGDDAGSHYLSGRNSHEQVASKDGHGSFDNRILCNSFSRGTSMNPENAFAPWMLAAPPRASPMPTVSYMSQPKSVFTPPYTGLSMCDAVHPAFRHVGDSPASQNTWTGDPKTLWRPDYLGTTDWVQKTFVPPSHGGRAYQQHPLQSTPSSLTQPHVPASTHYMKYYTLPQNMQHSTASSVDSKSVETEVSSNKEDDSDRQSDSESEFSDSDGDSSSKKRARGKSNVFKLENFPGIMDPIHTTLIERAYVCSLGNKSKVKGECRQRFYRPEHLRRHIRTVHSDVKNHICLVPGCGRSFSRNDNLRDHYWTHLSCGGGRGKNIKMSFAEIKKILGTSQKSLLKRLNRRLRNQKQRNKVKAKL